MKTIPLLWFAISIALGLSLAAQAGPKETTTLAPEKSAPLPIHTIEGVGGLVITPIAYLVNPGPAGTIIGLPSISTTFVSAGEKDLETVALTEIFFGRVELGYGVSRLGIGTLGDDVKEITTIALADYVVLHNFNARLLALPENSFDLPLPAVVIGASYKYNDGISKMNRQLGGVLNSIGYRCNEGMDFTLTASKQFPIFRRSLLLTAGLRLSEGEQLGYFGFGDKYRTTFESNVAYSIVDWLWLAAEFRGNANAYQQIANPKGGALVDRVDNWWALGATVLLSRHATVTVGWGHLGPIINTTENECLGIQVKYEF